MPRLKRLAFAFAVIALTCLAPAAAKADAIVINGGTYVVGSFFTNQANGLTNGSDFTLSASDISVVPTCLVPASTCLAGAPMSPSFSASALSSVTLVYNGVTYVNSPPGSVTIGNFFNFTGPSFTPLPGDPSTWEVPFTFTGQVILSNVSGGPTTFSLTGSGIARFEFEFGPAGFVQGRRGTYTFMPQATPEPATLVLFAGGAAALGLKIRRRRRAV